MRSERVRIAGWGFMCGLLACAGALAALVATPAGAFADGSDPAYPGSVLHVAVTGPLVAGQPLTITASGQNAPDALEIHLSYGLNVIVVDPTRLSGPCDQGYDHELTEITNNPGDGLLLTFAQLNEGSLGPFSIPLRFTPSGHGPLLVCAYSMYVTDDAAYASTEVQVSAVPTPPVHHAVKHHHHRRHRKRSGRH